MKTVNIYLTIRRKSDGAVLSIPPIKVRVPTVPRGLPLDEQDLLHGIFGHLTYRSGPTYEVVHCRHIEIDAANREIPGTDSDEPPFGAIDLPVARASRP